MSTRQPTAIVDPPSISFEPGEQPWTAAARRAEVLIDEALTESSAHLLVAIGWARSVGSVDLARTLEPLAGKVRAAQRAPRRTVR